MKKRITALLFAVCMLSGCTQNTPVQKEEEINEEKYRTIAETTGDEPQNMELMAEYVTEFDGIDGEVCISLYTSAQRDKTGSLMWDDTQEWVLYAKTDDGGYPLFHSRLSGRAYMKVADFYDNDKTDRTIMLDLVQNAGNTVITYAFDGENFVEKVAYSTDYETNGGISMMYSSVPEYE